MQRRPLQGFKAVILAMLGLMLAACGPEPPTPTAKQCEGAGAGALQCTPRCQAVYGVSSYCPDG